MISGIWFVLKTFVFTVLLLVLLQMKFGNKTLEERATLWVQQSNLVAPLDNFATQAARWIKSENKNFNLSNLWESVTKSVTSLFQSSETALNGMVKDGKNKLNQTIEKQKPKNQEIQKEEQLNEEPEEIAPQSSKFKWG